MEMFCPRTFRLLKPLQKLDSPPTPIPPGPKMNKEGELNWDKTGERKDSEEQDSNEEDDDEDGSDDEEEMLENEFKQAVKKENSVEFKDGEIRMENQVTKKSRSMV